MNEQRNYSAKWGTNAKVKSLLEFIFHKGLFRENILEANLRPLAPFQLAYMQTPWLSTNIGI